MSTRLKRHGKKPGRNLTPSRARYWARSGPARKKVCALMRSHKIDAPTAFKLWTEVRKRYYGEPVRVLRQIGL